MSATRTVVEQVSSNQDEENGQEPSQQPQTTNQTLTMPRRGLTWAADVVDNEGLGRKSSKCCCIYHKPKQIGESSSDETSSSDDSDTNAYEKQKKKKIKKMKHVHKEGEKCGSEK